MATFNRSYKTEKNRTSAFFEQHPPTTEAQLSAIQHAIEGYTAEQLRPLHSAVRGLEGIAVAGGVAANTRLPAVIAEVWGLPLWRPAHCGDETLAFGALWTSHPPARRPLVHFSGDLPGAPRPRTPPLSCRSLVLQDLVRALRASAVGVVAGSPPPDAWKAVRLGRALIETPGRRTQVSCRPIPHDGVSAVPREDQHVLVSSARLQALFRSPAPVFSPTHAFRLPARDAVRRAFNLSWAVVASLEEGHDAVTDRLLAAAQHCDVPVLFCRALRDDDLDRLIRGGGVRAVLMDLQLCT